MFTTFSRWHTLRVLLVVATTLAPQLPATAQTLSTPAASSTRPAASPQAVQAWQSILTPQSIAAVRILPRQILAKPALVGLPIEVATAAGEKYLGMDPRNVEQAIAVVEPPLGSTAYYAIFLRANRPWDLNRIAPELVAHTESGVVAGQPALISSDPNMPSMMVVRQRTLLLASPGMMDKLLKPGRPKAEGILMDLVASHAERDDLYVAANINAVSPLIDFAIQNAGQPIPPALQPLTQIPSLTQSVEVSLVFDQWSGNSTVLHTSDPSNADKLQKLMLQAGELSQAASTQQIRPQIESMRASSDPVQQAMASYFDRLMKLSFEASQPRREGNDLVYDATAENGKELGSIAVSSFLVGLLLPAVQAAREAARRNQALNNVKSINLAMHMYYDKFNHFPAHAIYSPEGKPLLSWRVALLPYLDEQELYDQFHLDEPWDSEHNRSLISQMPEVFRDPSSQLNSTDGKSSFLGAVAERFFFTGTESPRTFQQLADGTSMTLMFVQVNDAEAKIWTQPADWSLNPQTLGGLHPNGFVVGFADASARMLPLTLQTETLLKVLTVNGREVVAAEELQ